MNSVCTILSMSLVISTVHVICYNNRVDVLGHKYVFGLTWNHFSPSVARVKMSSEEGQKHIYAQEL